MGRQSVVTREETRRPSRRTGRISDRKNDIAETFSRELDETLGEIILPGRFGSPFSRKEADLYVNKRKWQTGARKPGRDFSHEQFLHQLYWPEIASDYPLLIISGAEGIGKSTLLRYYFDCYLPNFEQFPYMSESGPNSEWWERELSKHVVLYVDLRHAPSRNGVEKEMFVSFSAQIRRRFKNISSENRYAMWERVADWDDPLHSDAQASFDNLIAYRSDYVKQFFKQKDVFVEEALWYLSKQRDRGGNRRYYVSLIFDNLDQQFREIQEYVINIILGWVGEKIYHVSSNSGDQREPIDLWKAILPLRPETLRALGVRVAPTERKETFELGELDETLLLKTRTNKLQNYIKYSGRQVETDDLIEEDDTMVYLPLLSCAAAERMAEMLTYDYVVKDRRRKVQVKPGLRTREFLEDFCNRSIRRFLRVRKRLANSIALDRAVRLTIRHPSEHYYIPHYAFLDSVLTGGRDRFLKDDPDNDVLNVYDTTEQPASAYSLLVGPHVLYLLRRHHYTKRELVNALMQIGYSQAEVEDSLESMYCRSIIKYVKGQSSEDFPIYKEIRIIDAHLFLLTEHAYTDNMAMVTPVEPSIRAKMEHTVSYRREEFMARVRTSLSFLQQIRDDEECICTWREASSRHGVDRQKFEKDLNSLALPTIYRKVAISYRKGLERLSRRTGALNTVMERADWDELLNDDILKVEKQEEHIPLRPIIP